MYVDTYDWTGTVRPPRRVSKNNNNDVIIHIETGKQERQQPTPTPTYSTIPNLGLSLSTD